MPKKTKYTHVRVKQSTLARLKEAINRLCESMRRGQCTDARDNMDHCNPASLEMTVDSFINRLLDDRERHRVRVRRAAQKAARAEVYPDADDDRGE